MGGERYIHTTVEMVHKTVKYVFFVFEGRVSSLYINNKRASQWKNKDVSLVLRYVQVTIS